MNPNGLTTAPMARLSSQVPARGGRRKFTPERIQQIKNLVERGKSREEIAELIEVTVGSLQVTCSRLGISLRRPRLDNGIRLLPRGKPVPGIERATPHPSCDVSVPLQSIEEQSRQDSRPGLPEQTRHNPAPTVAKSESGGFAILVLAIRYKGEERTRGWHLSYSRKVGRVESECRARGETPRNLVAAATGRQRKLYHLREVPLVHCAGRFALAAAHGKLVVRLSSSSRLSRHLPSSPGWVHEIKQHGLRVYRPRWKSGRPLWPAGLLFFARFR